MLSLLIILLIIVLLICCYFHKKNKRSYWGQSEGEFWILTTDIVLLIALIIIIVAFIIPPCIGARYIDEKIIMYEEENKKIETQIDTLVENYMQYESETYKEFKGNDSDSITLVSLYPELKSDTLVQEQIRVHTENNQKIKELKEEKINAKVHKWLLYFG